MHTCAPAHTDSTGSERTFARIFFTSFLYLLLDSLYIPGIKSAKLTYCVRLYLLPMRTLIISYDLGVPENSASYSRLIAGIKTLGESVKPLKSFWILKTTYSADAVNRHLQQYMDGNDRWIVFDVTVHDKKGVIDQTLVAAVESI